MALPNLIHYFLADRLSSFIAVYFEFKEAEFTLFIATVLELTKYGTYLFIKSYL
jgi:hypothetical protein